MIGLVRYRALDIVRRQSREVPGYEAEDREDEIALTRWPAWSAQPKAPRCIAA